MSCTKKGRKRGVEGGWRGGGGCRERGVERGGVEGVGREGWRVEEEGGWRVEGKRGGEWRKRGGGWRERVRTDLISLVWLREASFGDNLPGVDCAIVSVDQLVALGKPSL